MKQAINWCFSCRTSLYAKVITSVAIVCLVLVGLDGWRTWKSRITQVAMDKIETANLARSLGQHAHDIIQSADTAVIGLRDVTESGDVKLDSYKHINLLMETQALSLPFINSMLVVDSSGNYKSNSLSKEIKTFNNSDRAYFQYHKTHQDRNVFIGGPVVSRMSGEWVLPISRRVDAPDGSFAGVVIVTISIDFLQKFYATFDTGRDGVIAMLTSEGILVARKPLENTKIGADISKGSFFRSIDPSTSYESLKYTSSFNGLLRLGSYYKVDGFAFMVVVAHGLQETLTEWRADALFHACITLMSIAGIAWVGNRLALQFQKLQLAEAAVRQSENHYRLLAENSTDMITKLTPDYRRVYASPSCQALLGYTPQELIGTHPNEFISADDWLAYSANLEAVSTQGHAPPITYQIRRKDGVKIWVETNGRRLDDGQGFVTSIRDITKRKEAEKQLNEANNKLQKLVMMDGLTEIANRRCFDLTLEKEYRRAGRGNLSMALLLIDVDHFKLFNDVYGHPAGDACLQNIAACIARQMQRPADLTARYGGEEFAVLLPDTTGAGAMTLANRICSAVQDLAIVHCKNETQVATVSIGVATIRPMHEAQTDTELVRMADLALYEAKASGRNRAHLSHEAEELALADGSLEKLCCLRTPITAAIDSD